MNQQRVGKQDLLDALTKLDDMINHEEDSVSMKSGKSYDSRNSVRMSPIISLILLSISNPRT